MKLLLWLLLIVGVARAQKGMSLEEKVKNLQEWLYKRPIISMNMDRWRTYVRTAPRNYSMVVLFTLQKNVDCTICKPALDEFYIMANSFRYAYPELKSLYFAVVNYEQTPEIFQQIHLNKVPALLHFPAKGVKKKADLMDFGREGFSAISMAEFVRDRTDVRIHVLRPPNYTAPAMVLLLGMLMLGLLYTRRNNLEFLYSRTTWGLICLCIVFTFMSGQMWNYIRGPPFVKTDPQTRETKFIFHSSRYQFVAESCLVAFLYAAVTAGFILLNEAVEVKGDPSRRRIMSFVGLGLVVVFFNLLLSIFRRKNGVYPYSFLFG